MLTLLVPVLYQRGAGAMKQSNGRALLCGLVFALATLTAFSPWLVRNYLWTGNPIYPLHDRLFQQLATPDASRTASGITRPSSPASISMTLTPGACRASPSRIAAINALRDLYCR